MLLWSNTNRFLARLNAPPTQSERLRVEKALALARVALTFISLIGVVIDPTEPSRYSTLVYALVTAWCLYSVGVVPWLEIGGVSNRRLLLLHLADIFWPSLISLFTSGPSSPFFPLFVFALVGSAFRWGFRETIRSALFIVAFVISESIYLTASTKPFHELTTGEFEINRFIIRSAYLFTFACLVGTLGENEKERRAESLVVARLLRSIRAERAVAVSVQAVFREFSSIFSVERAYIIAEDINSGRVFQWCGAHATTPELEPYVIESSESGHLITQNWPRTFVIDRQPSGTGKMCALSGSSVQESTLSVFPEIPGHSGEVGSLLCSAVDLGNEWKARIILVNPRLGRSMVKELRFAEVLFSQAEAALYSVYLVRLLRQRIGATERAHVARELHDGAIQSLISAEMRIDVLRRHASREALSMADELTRVQQLLREEVLNMRELMQQMKPVDLGPQQLVDVLADTVDRFRRDSGLNARFVNSVSEDVVLTPNNCREVVRIVQEGLANVRKHANAKAVLVTFGQDSGVYRLTINDDGKGFDFTGTVQFDDLLVATKGPMVIKERVHIVGGSLTIESKPGHGSRLEITIPRKGFSHGEHKRQSAHSDRG